MLTQLPSHILRRSNIEPHMNFFASFMWHGHIFRFFGKELTCKPYWSRPEQTFHEFLEHFILSTLSEEWWKIQENKRDEQKHVIYEWGVSYQHFKKSGGIDIRQEKDGSFSSLPSGPALCWLMLGYDLLCLFHANSLPNELIEKLKIRKQFQSARFELAVAATLLRCGCDIMWIEANKLPPGERSCEFIATHRASGIKFGVEAKSKRRPGVLSHPGKAQQKLKGILDLIKDAFERPCCAIALTT